MARALAVAANVAAQNTFTSSASMYGHFNVSVSGISGDTVTLQRSFDGGQNWLDVASYDADAEDVHFEPEAAVLYRIGVKTGDYSAGTINLRLSQ